MIIGGNQAFPERFKIGCQCAAHKKAKVRVYIFVSTFDKKGKQADLRYSSKCLTRNGGRESERERERGKREERVKQHSDRQKMDKMLIQKNSVTTDKREML